MKDILIFHGAPFRGPECYVKRLINAKGINITEASELIGVNQSTLSRFLNGGNLTVEMAVKINKGLGVDVQILFNLDAERKSYEAKKILELES